MHAPRVANRVRQSGEKRGGANNGADGIKMLLNEIYTGDAAQLLKELDRESIDLVVTSPPYDNLRTYNGYVFDFEAIARGLWRVIKRGGVVVWVVGDETIDGSETTTSAEQKIFFRGLGFNIHDTMIYEKTNFSNPERTRYHQVFEYAFVFSKGAPKIFNPIKDKKNSTAGETCFGLNRFTERDGTKTTRTRKFVAEFGMRGNVWRGKTRGQEEICVALDHPAMMPMWLARDHILSWSNPGDVVLDPMCGSGTTLIQAKRLGREYIGFEISEVYAEKARRQLSNTQTPLIVL